MKLYIPTCTLNLNNILSTESISPAIFYPQRKFGIKRFERVEVSNFNYVIALYSVFPSYNVQDIGLDNYPMIIEIETETLPVRPEPVAQRDGVDIYISKSTIYLNPFTTVFYVTQNVFPIIKSKSDESMENKLFSLYRQSGCFKQIPSNQIAPFNLTQSYNETIPDQADSAYERELEKERVLDRIKGFAYCYLIGANSALPKEVSKLKLLAKNIKNTLAAIVNSPTRKPTSIQDEKLRADVNLFNEIFQTVDPICLQNQANIKQRVAEVNPQQYNVPEETFWKLLKGAGVEKAFLESCNLDASFDVSDIYSCMGHPIPSILDEYSRVVCALSTAVTHVEQQTRTKTKATPIDLLFIGDKNTVTVVDKSFDPALYNDFLKALIQNEHERAMHEHNVRQDIAVALICGQIYKREFADRWEGSTIQQYVNGLLENLQNTSHSFDINSIDFDEAKALSAFAQKGSDIDKLTNYLLHCGFYDYRLAYGLYGATEGFATLPKTFTNELLGSTNEYICTVYKYIYQGCHGVSLDSYQLQKKGENIEAPKVQEKLDYKPATTSESINLLLDELKPFIKDNAQEDKIEKLIKPHYEGKVDLIFYEKIKDLEAPYRMVTVWKNCIKHLKKSLSTSTREESPNLFDKPLLFIDDISGVRAIVDQVLQRHSVNMDVCNKILKNLKWIHDGYRTGGSYFYDQEKYPPDNHSMIRHFGNVCFAGSKNPDKIEKTKENSELVDILTRELNKKYP